MTWLEVIKRKLTFVLAMGKKGYSPSEKWDSGEDIWRYPKASTAKWEK